MSDAWLDAISEDACLSLLRAASVGRIALLAMDGPIILPVNYRLVEPASGPLVAIRTRPGNVIDQAPENVAFEIDAGAVMAGWPSPGVRFVEQPNAANEAIAAAAAKPRKPPCKCCVFLCIEPPVSSRD